VNTGKDSSSNTEKKLNHVDSVSSKTLSSLTDGESTMAKKSEGSGSGSGASDLMSVATNNDDAGESGDSSSGSGDAGEGGANLEGDMKELAFLTGLNFEDSDAGDLDNDLEDAELRNSDSHASTKENNHVRDEIEEPEDTSMKLLEPSEEEDGDESATEDASEEEAKEESGSGSGTSDEESGSGNDETTAKKDQTETEEDEESGQSEESKEEDEEPEKDAAKPVQSAKQEKQANKFNKGEISVLLRQGFKSDFSNKDSAPYRMLSGNVVHDFEKALKVEVSDVSFSEGSIDGNPKQTGKTKMSFTVSGSDQKVLKKLTKLVNTDQSINGLSVYSGSLEYDDERK